MKIQFLFSILLLFSLIACQSQPTNPSSDENAPNNQVERAVGGPCECCEAIFDGMPSELGWQAQISAPDEPGEPLEIAGTIFKKDGKTPAEGVVLYVYHTDNQGLYSNGPKTSACAERHGHLRAWIKTGADGRYQFKTIRPASYPGTEFEQHVHPVVKEPGLALYWIDEFVFEDDPKLTEAVIAKHQNRGGTGVMKLVKNAAGTWVGQRDITLGLNVAGY